MADLVMNEFKAVLARGASAAGTAWPGFASADIRVLLSMSSNNVLSTPNADTLSALSLDEMDGANYVRKALTGEVVTENSGQSRAEMDANDVTWTSLGAGTRQVNGALVYWHIGADSVNVPICWKDSGGFPFTMNGGNFTVQWATAGILYAT